jgi:hypothetical protein
MIAQNLHSLKVEKSNLTLTSFAGLPLLTELAQHCGVVRLLDALPGLWRRSGIYKTSDYVMALALSLIGGGETLDDIRLLRSDEGLAQLSLPDIPAANSVGDFLRRFGHKTIYRLSEIVTRQALLNVKAGQTLTLDIDSSLIEAQKEQAKMTYAKFTGYNPLLAWIAEADVFIAGLFRDGNSSPQSHILRLLNYCRQKISPDNQLRFRSDSAGYQLAIMEYCHRNGVDFTISADLDVSVRDVIANIPGKDWRLVVYGHDVFLMAETVHAPGSGSKQQLPAFRLIVTRKLSGQLELFEDVFRHRAIITNLPPSWSAEAVLVHHNARGNVEKAIAELKNGFALHKLPCGELMANAAYCQVCLLAYNLVRTLKNHALPDTWRNCCVKNLRYRLLCRAAVVVRHARRLILRLPSDFAFFDVFERARWAVLSPELSVT